MFDFSDKYKIQCKILVMNTKCMRSWTNNTAEKERNSESSFQRPMGKYMNSKYVHTQKKHDF